ncbi:T9SS type A sorting domain-containing protein [Marinilabilia rubra]|uniref:Secretion system C-terminal sorting domain-containing protein n=1 Tax=Marinilabilia rubra TaxID=2162893 RepID=A0A2U2BB51_9BACT|nr:T9SS type A sorting domain-containing protein [Marinilabilia rubra]PWE00302.1 hypothetical protein DDZ16_05010 [Marinilabilia rubra]
MKKFTLIYLIALTCLGLQAQTHEDRIKVFENFTIKGAGGEEFLELAASYGANTIRTWSSRTDGSTKALLDSAHALGLKVELGFWMPYQGDNGGWIVDYNDPDDYQKYEDKLQELLDSLDYHPAILCWELGNEVNGGASNIEYMKAANKLSKVIHAHNPNRLTSLVTNASKAETIQDFATYCTDLDIIGKNGYGANLPNLISRFDTHWGKPWYISEYNTRGQWDNSLDKTSWGGDAIDIPPSVKVQDVVAIHNGFNNTNSTLFKGATAFTWTVHENHNYVWHSLLLSDDLQIQSADQGMVPLLTPMADEVVKYWRGSYPENRAPVISNLKLASSNAKELIIDTGEEFTMEVTASDPDADEITYKWWIYSYERGTQSFNGSTRRKSLASGPFETGSTNSIKLTAPNNYTAEDFHVYCVALDGNGSASAHTFPIKVTGTPEPPAVDSDNLIVDGNFEAGDLEIGWADRWNGKLEEADTYEGNFAGRLSTESSFIQFIDVEPGSLLNLSFAAKWVEEITTDYEGLKMTLRNGPDNELLYKSKTTKATEWTVVEDKYKVPDTVTQLKVVLYIPKDLPVCLVDNVVVERYNPSISITDDGEIIAGSEDGEVIIVSLTDDSFVDNLISENWTVTNLPEGVSVGSINRIDDSTAEIVLTGNATSNYGNISNTTVTIAAADLTLSNTDLTVDNGVVFGNLDTAIDDCISDMITIYPNPASDVFNIKTTNEINRISVFNVFGKKILDLPHINSSKAIVNISELKKGFYFVEIKNRMGNRIITRLIKE